MEGEINCSYMPTDMHGENNPDFIYITVGPELRILMKLQ